MLKIIAKINYAYQSVGWGQVWLQTHQQQAMPWTSLAHTNTLKCISMETIGERQLTMLKNNGFDKLFPKLNNKIKVKLFTVKKPYDIKQKTNKITI